MQFDYGSLTTLLVVYFSLCCYTAGTAPSLGTMVPALLIGGKGDFNPYPNPNLFWSGVSEPTPPCTMRHPANT